ncbi:MAG TPA: 50S ribosomal protein L4 [Firmicutes bacterium]|nr:50S ribosomal protein L4 [Bacillota bacterium]
MPKVAVYDMEGRVVGEIDLDDRVFGVEVNQALLHQAVVMYQANQRQGTAATKNRALVSGGGRKPWRQKGTGRARQGTIRAPQWRGGGTVFGPTPRDYRQAMPRKARQAALRSALSAKAQAGEIVVLDELSLAEPKTKLMAKLMAALEAGKALVVTPEADENLIRSARNLPYVGLSPVTDLNAYIVLLYDKLVLTRDAVGRLEEALA